ncbi:unnamed protein product [Microthlaspi erraticum]|uniref:MULE transposase domain-containing protein n=1 Tax=Microthlaspi erraticum TaxID=1685480 RepID=A0A6D2JQ44_9BRAS|nr:unnamed protein product [Microthlaspi erraticum]CAA7039424.1 unnamed protein product [Microthlaspi erraticum]
MNHKKGGKLFQVRDGMKFDELVHLIVDEFGINDVLDDVQWRVLRLMLKTDGTFLKGKYKGTLLVATAQDGNSQIFPLAFGVVDSENDASWEWFFTQLKTVVPDDPRLVVISDRHAYIAKVVKKVYPSALCGICIYHLQKNIIKKFRGKYLVRLVDDRICVWVI